MRIAQLITSLRLGGAERLVVEMMPYYINAGIDCMVIVMDGTPTPLLEQLVRLNIPVHALSYGAGAMRNPLLINRIRQAISGYDIVHSHNSSCQLMLPLARHPHQKIVTTEHNTHNRRRTHRILRQIDRLAYSHYDKIICVSNSVRGCLEEWIGDDFAPKLVTIHNGIDHSRFKATRESKSKAVKPLPGDKIILMVAGFRPAKDHQTAIHAMKMLPKPYKLRLVGSGETERECKALVTKLSLEDRIEFIGQCNDITQHLGNVHASILISHHEGHPLSVIESMAAGIPFIGSDIPSIREVAGDAAILVKPRDPASLANAILCLNDSPSLHSALISKGLARAQSFNIADTAAHHLRLYRDLLP